MNQPNTNNQLPDTLEDKLTQILDDFYDGVFIDELPKALKSLTTLLQDEYRRAYIAGHQKGTYGKSKRELRYSSTSHTICPVCKQKQSELEESL